MVSLHILCLQINAHQFYFEVLFCTCQNNYNQQNKGQMMLVWMWSKGNIHLLLLGMQTYTATMEISWAVPYEDTNMSTSISNSIFICIVLGHIPKGYLIISQRSLLIHVTVALFIRARNWKKKTRHPSITEWIQKSDVLTQWNILSYLKMKSWNSQIHIWY